MATKKATRQRRAETKEVVVRIIMGTGSSSYATMGAKHAMTLADRLPDASTNEV